MPSVRPDAAHLKAGSEIQVENRFVIFRIAVARYVVPIVAFKILVAVVGGAPRSVHIGRIEHPRNQSNH